MDRRIASAAAVSVARAGASKICSTIGRGREQDVVDHSLTMVSTAVEGRGPMLSAQIVVALPLDAEAKPKVPFLKRARKSQVIIR